MTGPKLNEGALLIPEGQPTTKATAKYVRGSASKAREVLDLIRGLDVRRADEVLQFTTRDVARDVRKVLASAVANAVHNDSQDGDELFVLAAFADEGPTLRRFRPRARGRATRIRKRTCHLTVVVARLSDERLEVLQNRQQATTPAGRRRAGTSADSRRARVERSRTRAQGLRDQPVEPADEAGETLDTEEIETTDGVATFADVTPETVDTAAETEAAMAGGELLEAAAGDTGSADEASGAQADDVAGADVVGAETAEPETAEAGTVELPAGAVPAPPDGSVPEGHEIKANASSKMYHVPGSRYYEVTIGELFFDTPEHARAAGYQPPAGAAGQEN